MIWDMGIIFLQITWVHFHKCCEENTYVDTVQNSEYNSIKCMFCEEREVGRGRWRSPHLGSDILLIAIVVNVVMSLFSC